MKTFEERFDQVIVFKFNVRDTNQEEKGEQNSVWLRRSGYKEAEITEKLLDIFKRVFCRRFKSAADALKISEEDQPWNNFWVRKKHLSSDMLGLLPKWFKFVNTLVVNKITYFKRIGLTILLLLLLVQPRTKLVRLLLLLLMRRN